MFFKLGYTNVLSSFNLRASFTSNPFEWLQQDLLTRDHLQCRCATHWVHSVCFLKSCVSHLQPFILVPSLCMKNTVKMQKPTIGTVQFLCCQHIPECGHSALRWFFFFYGRLHSIATKTRLDPKKHSKYKKTLACLLLMESPALMLLVKTLELIKHSSKL